MIIFLNGSKDAGKTTTAEIVKRIDPRIAVVEPDVFYPFLPDHLTILEKAPVCVELSAHCIRALVTEGYIVLVAYPITIWDYERYRHLLSEFVDEMLFITLAPEKQKLLARLNLLEEHDDLARFRRMVIDQHYEPDDNAFDVVNPPYPSVIIDNSDLTPEETAQEVYAHITDALSEPK